MPENAPQTSTPRLLDASHLRDYAIFMIGIAFVVLVYHVLTGGLTGIPGGQPSPQRPGGLQIFEGALNLPDQMYDIWPLWGTLVLPSFEGVALALAALILLSVSLISLKKRQYALPSLAILVSLGLVLLLLTNLIQGWSTGIESTISGMSEMYWDISKVVSPLNFISNFNSLQAGLSLHAQTQPPGAVLTIYFFNLLFQSPALIAIDISVVAEVFSAFSSMAFTHACLVRTLPNMVFFSISFFLQSKSTTLQTSMQSWPPWLQEPSISISIRTV
jgi:hypothetical protein